MKLHKDIQRNFPQTAPIVTTKNAVNQLVEINEDSAVYYHNNLFRDRKSNLIMISNAQTKVYVRELNKKGCLFY